MREDVLHQIYEDHHIDVKQPYYLTRDFESGRLLAGSRRSDHVIMSACR
jgi:hypothetical protein